MNALDSSGDIDDSLGSKKNKKFREKELKKVFSGDNLLWNQKSNVWNFEITLHDTGMVKFRQMC